jgi:1,4-alpha-glucan branching enzyme
MGGEIGQFDEWSETRSLDWHLLEYDSHKQLQKFVNDVNELYKKEPALYKYDFDGRGFEWVSPDDGEESIVSFIRKADNIYDNLIIICNFTPVPRMEHRVGVNHPGIYEEVLNSDDLSYGGGGIINGGDIRSSNISWNFRENSVVIKAPPLGVTILRLKKSL